jgi:hypothetical protein
MSTNLKLITSAAIFGTTLLAMTLVGAGVGNAKNPKRSVCPAWLENCADQSQIPDGPKHVDAVETDLEDAPTQAAEPRLTCKQGKRIVKRAGFRHIKVIDCKAPTYAYRVQTENGGATVIVNMFGEIIAVNYYAI